MLLAGNKLSNDELNMLGEMIGEQDIEPLLQAANSDSEDAQSARQELVSMLMDRHGTSRVLFRNTRNGVKGFPKRELHTIKLPLPTQYQTAIKVSGIMGARKSAEDRARDMLYPERIYQEFEGDNATWWNFDPRVEWLMGYLTSHRSQKVLVICAKAATALQLEQVLREREGIRAAVFHEGMSIIERDRAAAWFAEEDTGAQVLLCSEIGSEGRNFQFASHMVMFDLPFNPDLLEQRIGRLDRIGQAHDIQIHVPYFDYWLVFIIGVPGVRPVVGEIAANSIAAEAQIAPGTELKAVDGIETPDWDAVRLQLVDKIGDESTTITVAPFGSDQRRDVKLDLRHWAFEPDKEDPVSSLGIRPRGPQIEPVLENVQPNSAASKAGLQAGDRIVKVDGQPLTQWVTFVMLVRDNPGKSLALEIERQGSPLSLTLIPESKPGNGKAIGFVGIEPKVIPLPDEYKVVRQYGPFNAIVEATDKTWQLMKLTVSMLGKLITGDVKLNNLSGPISIAKGAGMTAELGVVYYLPFLALISVNLGIINLFPLPVLDGGHLLFLAIEKIKGGPVSERVQDFCYRIGSILLVLLMGLALFNDFSRL